MRARRAAIVAAVCILAGMVLTVAVAWGCWLNPRRVESHASAVSITDERNLAWARKAPYRSSVGVDYRVWIFLGAGWTFDRHTLNGTPGDGWRAERYVRVGLPARALSMRTVIAPVAEEESIPVIPVFPGFAIDTAFYGSLVFLAWNGRRLHRRLAILRALRARRRRGLCRTCGYSRAGLPADGVCPECGAV